MAQVGDIRNVFFGDLHDFFESAVVKIIRSITCSPTKRFIPAMYCGTKLPSSFCQPRLGTMTVNSPLSKECAEVFSATAFPHTTAHASRGCSFAGARRNC